MQIANDPQILALSPSDRLLIYSVFFQHLPIIMQADNQPPLSANLTQHTLLLNIEYAYTAPTYLRETHIPPKPAISDVGYVMACNTGHKAPTKRYISTR